jgi:ABC-type lipopolysaccharide export system ATPase subunit
LKQVLGLAKPDAGSIMMNGVDITAARRPSWARFAGVSVLPFRPGAFQLHVR